MTQNFTFNINFSVSNKKPLNYDSKNLIKEFIDDLNKTFKESIVIKKVNEFSGMINLDFNEKNIGLNAIIVLQRQIEEPQQNQNYENTFKSIIDITHSLPYEEIHIEEITTEEGMCII